MTHSATPPVVAVVGATAAGKSGLALDLAERLGGEIVNTDAMQLYAGMDVGTAKIPPRERRGIPHHLLDVLAITEPASVAQFQQWAREAVADVRVRGRVPVLVGGSALYTRAVLDHFEFPGTDPEVRARLQHACDENGVVALYTRLQREDPEAAEQIRPENERRIVRALEVIELTGRPFSATLPRREYVDPGTVQIGVTLDRATLDARIEQRVREMFDAGLVEEVVRLREAGLDEAPTASRAIGYRQVLAYLDGKLTWQQVRERTMTATRRFARRQDSWFGKDDRIHWVAHDAPARLQRVLALVPGRDGGS